MGTETQVLDDFDLDDDIIDLEEDHEGTEFGDAEFAEDAGAEDGAETEAFSVEIVDDTPSDDVGRPDDPDALPEDTNDEAMTYSRKVKQRIDRLTLAANTERRAREKLKRENDEAVGVIRNMMASQETSQAEVQSLREKLYNGEKVYVTEVLGSLEAKLANATDAYRQAYELGKTDELVQANQDIATLTQRIELAKQYTPEKVAPAEAAAPAPTPEAAQPARAPEADPIVKEWVARNSWFSDPNTGPMKTVAMAIHGKLIEKGVHPTLDSTKYYATIDAEMRKRFPEYRWPDIARKRKSLTTNAAGTRRTKGRQVKLSKSQVALAESLGLTPQQYAEEVVKLSNRRGG